MKTKLFTLLLAVAASVGTMSAAITVRLDPSSCSSWSTVRLWAWTDEGNLFDSWPGQIVSLDSDGWYSYTFDASITSVNIIWNNGNDQTIDITNVSVSTCFALIEQTGKIGVNTVDCTTGQYLSTTGNHVPIGDLYYNLSTSGNTAEVTYGNYKFSSVTIPSSVIYNGVSYTVTSIGKSAFENRSSLTSVTIPNSVTSIGEYAFYKCSFLTSITIPNSVTSIGDGAFSVCSSLTSINVDANNPNYCSIDGVLFSKDKTTLIQYPIGNTRSEYIIPNSVTSIGLEAFCGCSSLTSITIPNSVTSIGNLAFFNCTSLTSITIPNSVTSIGNYAFSVCSSLTSINVDANNPNYCSIDGVLFNKDKTTLVACPGGKQGAYTIPNSVTSIGLEAFCGCSSLTSITIPNSVTSIGNLAFYDCTSLTSITIPNSVTSIGSETFRGCSSLTSVTIPNSVTSIGDYAFSDCESLTSVTIGNSVTSIGENAFRGCSSLTSITIPNSVTSIGNLAFYDCTSLTSITIPNSVTIIGDYAFYRCSSLTSITIPNSVTSIGWAAFAYCSSLTSVTIEAETPPTSGNSVFTSTNNCPIYVPCGTLDAYKTAWSEHASRIQYEPLEYNITGNVNNEAAGNVQIPQNKCEDVIAIPNYGYHFTQWSDGNTDNPRTIVLASDTSFTAEFAYDRVGTCGKDLALVWSYDPTNKVLTIGNAGEFTENMQFGVEAPGEMEELVIGNSVTAIGENAFAGISTLKKVTIGESVKTIHNNAFYNCVNLETIFNYRPTPTNAYSTAFDGVDKFACSLYVLPSSIDMYKNASVWRDFYYTYAIGAEETTVTTNNVTVEPQDNAATVTWPTSENATTYTLQITKDGEVFCTLIFNGNGQLTGIAFAPSRDGQAHAPAAIMTANGLQFTVTGLNSNTQYGYNLTAKDANDQTVATYSGSFTTTSEGIATGVEEVSSSLQGGDRGRLILHNGQVLILRGEKVYTIDGRKVR